MSLQKPKVGYAAMKWQDAAICGKFKYPGLQFTIDVRWNVEIYTWNGKENAVLRELYRSVVIKRELPSTAKLSVSYR